MKLQAATQTIASLLITIIQIYKKYKISKCMSHMCNSLYFALAIYDLLAGVAINHHDFDGFIDHNW